MSADSSLRCPHCRASLVLAAAASGSPVLMLPEEPSPPPVSEVLAPYRRQIKDATTASKGAAEYGASGLRGLRGLRGLSRLQPHSRGSAGIAGRYGRTARPAPGYSFPRVLERLSRTSWNLRWRSPT